MRFYEKLNNSQLFVLVRYSCIVMFTFVIVTIGENQEVKPSPVQKPKVAVNQKTCICLRKLFSGIVIVGRGWKTYMKYDVAFAGLALFALYMIVLGFDNVTVCFAYTQGINESIMGILMAASAAFGILGAVIYPCLRKRIGLVLTGIFGITFLCLLLFLCVLSIWTPGSPFDPYFLTRRTDLEAIKHPITNASIETKILTDHFEAVSATLSFDDVTNGVTTSLGKIVLDEAMTSYISIILLMTGMIGGRCGLWIADLTISQLFLETIIESERGIVLGVQTSLNQLMDMLKFVLVVVLPQPEVFGVLILISYAFICIGWLLYARFTFNARGHLSNCKRPKHVDDTRNNKNEVII